MMDWIIIAIILVLVCTLAAVLLVVLGDRERRGGQRSAGEGTWNLEMWNIRHGFPVNLVISNHMILGRGHLHTFVVSAGLTESDKTVSREHCMIYEQNDTLWVWNLSAVNPTTLNGHRLNAPRQLMPGDRLGMGNSTYLVTRVDKSI